MSDQADNLRKLIRTATLAPEEATARLPMVVVSGAKSGVGATTVAVNLAAVLADRGERVAVVDAAQHRNELVELAGAGRDFEYSLSDVMAGKCSVQQALVRGAASLRVLANRSRVSSRRDSEFRRNSATCVDSRGAQQRLLAGLESLRDEVDLIVVDAGRGWMGCARRFWMRAQLAVLVTTTEDASLLDAYAALKLSAADGIRPVVGLLVNQAENDGAAEDAQRRVQSACQRFLSLSIESLPALPRHEYEYGAGAPRGLRIWERVNSSFGHAALWMGRSVSDLLATAARDAAAPEMPVPELHEMSANVI